MKRMIFHALAVTALAVMLHFVAVPPGTGTHAPTGTP